MAYLTGSYQPSADRSHPMSAEQCRGLLRPLVTGARALAGRVLRAFWSDVMIGLASHGASLGGLPPPDEPTNWREADLAALLDTEPVEKRS